MIYKKDNFPTSWGPLVERLGEPKFSLGDKVKDQVTGLVFEVRSILPMPVFQKWGYCGPDMAGLFISETDLKLEIKQ